MRRCQTNKQGLACVTYPASRVSFERANKLRWARGRGFHFIFFSRLSCSVVRLTKPPCFTGRQGLLSMPGFSTTYGEKKYREVSKSYSTTSFSALSTAVTQGLVGSTDFKEGCRRRKRREGEG